MCYVACSLCRLFVPSCSSAPRSAQTCFSLPPLNSLLSERGQRPGTVTQPGGGWGGWKAPHLPPSLPSLRDGPFLRHLFILYTPESLLLSRIDWQSAERAAVSSFLLHFGLFGQINKCSTGGCMESLCVCVCVCACVWKKRGWNTHGNFAFPKIRFLSYNLL